MRRDPGRDRRGSCKNSRSTPRLLLLQIRAHRPGWRLAGSRRRRDVSLSIGVELHRTFRSRGVIAVTGLHVHAGHVVFAYLAFVVVVGPSFLVKELAGTKAGKSVRRSWLACRRTERCLSTASAITPWTSTERSRRSVFHGAFL